MGITNLPLGHTDKAFLVAVIDFDFPTVDVGLDEGLEIQFRIGAYEERGFAIEEFGAFAQPITQRLDDHQQ